MPWAYNWTPPPPRFVAPAPAREEPRAPIVRAQAPEPKWKPIDIASPDELGIRVEEPPVTVPPPDELGIVIEDN